MRYLLSILIASQITSLLIVAASAQTSSTPFNSAGVNNPSAPVGVSTPTAGSTQQGTALVPASNNPQGTPASTLTPLNACLGTDLLLQHGFTQSELDRLEQEKKLSYPSRMEYKDTDNDGLFDNEELLLKTDPNKADTDGDGFLDAAEVAFGFDPLQGKNARPFSESLNNVSLWASQIIQTLRHALSKLP